MYTLTVPIASARQLPKLVFPERCLKCGNPKAGTRKIAFDMNTASRKKSIMLEIEPPLCRECIELENKMEWFSLLPFTISALLFAVAGFLFLFFFLPLLPVWNFLGIDNRLTGESVFVLSGAGALVAAVAGGTMVEFVLKLLAAPYFGKLIISRPPTIIALSRDLHDVVGLRAQLTGDKKTLTLTFEHEEMAKEFAALNGLAL